MSLYGHTTFDPELGVHCCQLIRQVQPPGNRASLDNLVRVALEGAPFQSHYFAGLPTFPSWYMAWNADDGVIVFNGCETVGMGVAWLNGYSSQTFIPHIVQRNEKAEEFADAFVQTFPGGSALTSQRCLITGHSMGGAIGMALARRRAIAGNQAGTRVITFGAPHYCDQATNENFNGTFITRWMNDDDPVPIVPPRPGLAWAMMAVVNLATSLNWGLFQQSKGGLQLDTDGNMTEQYLPTNATPSDSLALGTWLWNLDTGAYSGHSIGEYLRRLSTRWTEIRPPVAIPGAQEGGIIAPLHMPKPLVRRDQEDLRGIIRREGASPSGEPLIPRDQIFYKVKYGNVWAVAFAGKIISVGWTRRKAGHLATAGNIFIKRLLRQSLVDPVALTSQFATFCVAAQDSGSGIRPLMTTRLPSIMREEHR